MNAQSPPPAVRHHLPDERASITHKFIIEGYEGYITVGLYPDRQPGEIFVIMAKEGSTIAGMMDSFAISISLALQHGVPLKLLCEKFAHTRFEPSGWTQNPDLGYAKSVMDYVFRWLRLRFIEGKQSVFLQAGQLSIPIQESEMDRVQSATGIDAFSPTDEPSCRICGSIMRRNGTTCHCCTNCGSSSGCGYEVHLRLPIMSRSLRDFSCDALRAPLHRLNLNPTHEHA